MSDNIAIAIDGPSGAGKSTVARSIARRLRILYLDTGAMYRAVGYKALERGIDTHDEKAVSSMLEDTDIRIEPTDGGQRIYIDGRDVTNIIRTQEAGLAGSDVSTLVPVRERLVQMQKDIAASRDVVMDGRDIGTHVLPDAPYKFYLTADSRVRAQRRVLELRAKGIQSDIEDVHRQILARDHQDMTRAASPLKQAPDAQLIDSTDMTADQVVQVMLERVSAGRGGA